MLWPNGKRSVELEVVCLSGSSETGTALAHGCGMFNAGLVKDPH